MRKNEYDVPVDWGKLSSHKPSRHAKSDKQIYYAKVRMAAKKCKIKELKMMPDIIGDENIGGESRSIK